MTCHKKRMGEERMKHIPEEVITGILLSDLPIKTLLRFKSVSKSWRSLLSSEEFVQHHLKISNSHPDFAHHRLISNHCKDKIGPNLRSCSLKSLLDEPNQNAVVPTHDHPYPTTRATDCSVKILGSCNGLLFIKNLRGFFLWNPSTRKLKTIPQPSFSPPRGERVDRPRAYSVYGFGYDDSTDEYKVVWVISYSKPGDTEIHHTKIYSVRTDSWKKIENFGKRFRTEYPGIFVNGKLHWLGAKEENKWNIVSLGLVEDQEKYQVVATPEYYAIHRPTVPKLESLGGYLSLICSSSRFNEMMDIEVWVMMEYGVAESWTKIWKLPKYDYYVMGSCTNVWIASHFNDPRRILDYCRPFWVTKNGDHIFVLFGKRGKKKGNAYQVRTQGEIVVVYNGGTKLRECPIDKDELQDEDFLLLEYSVCELTYKPIVYVESLVSP